MHCRTMKSPQMILGENIPGKESSMPNDILSQGTSGLKEEVG
jgi:hypothetical protein